MTTKECYTSLKLFVGKKGGKQQVTPLILGKPGIGKSYIVKKLAQEEGYSHFIDFRLSQHDETDFKIPNRGEKFFSWITNDLMPVENNPKYTGPGILFLDEFNRASEPVQQAIFQLVYDRMIGTEKIRDDWKIICAGNLGMAEDKTFVNDLDPALLNRFAMLKIDSVILDEYLEEEPNLHKVIKGYLLKNPSKLYVSDYQYLVTPRSWTTLSNILSEYSLEEAKQVLLHVGKPLVHDAFSSLVSFFNSFHTVGPKEVLNNYDEVVEILKAYERPDIHGLNIEIIETLSSIRPTEHQIRNFDKYFFEILSEDNRVYVAKMLLNKNKPFLKKWVVAVPEHNEEGSYFNELIKRVL